MDAEYHRRSLPTAWKELWRAHRGAILAAGIAGLTLRLFFIIKFSYITPDGWVYGDIAKNWLTHGVYGLSGPTGPEPTYIRLPGYPAFLAALWAIFGLEHYNAVRYAQMLLDLGTCLMVADMARRIAGERAALPALWLAALCPFLANYVALPLTETLAVFFTALALDFAIAGLESLQGGRLQRRAWLGCGLAIAAGLYMRPDAGILLVAIGGYLLFRVARVHGQRRATVAALLLAVAALLPLAPWTLRNWRVIHRFQPLAPVAANHPQEFVARGFERWVRTWLVDFASMEDIVFRVDGEPVNFRDLPARAFDSDDQRRRTEELFAAYQTQLEVTPDLDAAFSQLAQERILRAPLRYYIWLPLLRGLDMWFRPRVEMLPLDAHWWRYWDDPRDFAISAGLGFINLAYVLAALIGLWRGRPRFAGMLLAFALLRTVLIATMVGPEPRYVLECYPVVIAWAALLPLTVYSERMRESDHH